jgi:hypothetical protein
MYYLLLYGIQSLVLYFVSLEPIIHIHVCPTIADECFKLPTVRQLHNEDVLLDSVT